MPVMPRLADLCHAIPAALAKAAGCGSRWALLCLFPFVAACSIAPPAPEHSPAAEAVPASAFAGWQHWPLPGKLATHYTGVKLDGREAMAARSESSASLLRRRVRVEPQDLGRVRFSWKVPELIAQADLAQRDRSDSPVRLVLAFEGDRSQFSMKDGMLSELSRALTGEPLPYATLMYVWCNTRPPGSVIPSPRTDRIRKLVLESGPQNLNRWLDYERDIRADFIHAFGEPPGALIGIALMTDTDNTRSSARAWYGPVTLEGVLTAAQ